MTQKKSPSISSFLLVLLIVSTAIVFAVLLFLSYENIINSTYQQCSDEVELNCGSFTSTAEIIIGNEKFSFSNDDLRTELIKELLDNMISRVGGSGYICDEKGKILYYREMISGYSIDLSGAKTNGYDLQSIPLDESRTVLTATKKISNSNIFFVYAKVSDRGTALMQFNDIILYPALIAVAIAIVLFVFGIQMTMTPIRDMTRVFNKISEGDYSVRVDEKYIKGRDNHYTTASGDIASMASVVNDMISKLENQENDRQIFISSVAHDIRTPLTSINGFVTAIMDGTIPPEKQDHYLQLIKQELNRIRTLVVTMTEASSLSHVDPDVMEKFSLDDVVNDIVENLEPQLNTKNITAEVRLDSNEKAKVCYGEAQQLCRVIVNIITNAIKFTPDYGKIIVSTKADPDNKRVLISVEDSGIGIPQEKRSRVFESFYKVDTSRTHEGFGLGLYICKQILVGHGQTIYLDDGNELGGAKFVFSFPMPPEDK